MTAPMIYKSNALIEASYELTVLEQRIILTAITKVRRDEPVTDDVMYSVSAQELAGESGVSLTSMYSRMKQAAFNLKKRDVWLTHLPNGAGPIPKKRRQTGWVQTVDYIDGEGRVELRFSKDILPYLTQLTGYFTQYPYPDIAHLESQYAIRLYELLLTWGPKGMREVSLESLRDWFALGNAYPVLKDFKKWVLDVACEQVSQWSPYKVEYSQRRTGRSVSHIIFSYGPKTAKKRVKLEPKGKNIGTEQITQLELSNLAMPGESEAAARARLRTRAAR